MKKVKKIKNIKDEANNFHASIKILGKKYEAKGLTAREAIGNLKVGGFVKSMGVLEVV